MQHDLRHDCTLHRRCGSITERTNILIVITVISQVDGRPPCVNGVITIQWEWSNFDPSKNQNPLTDDDKTLHNWLRPRDKRVSQNLCQMAVRVRLGKYVKYNTNNFFFSPDSPTEVILGQIFTHNDSNYAQSRKEVPFWGLHDGQPHLGGQIPQKTHNK